MINFNFTLEDSDAENLFSLIGNTIADNHMKIQSAMLDHNQVLVDAYKQDIDYLLNLKSKLTCSRVTENKLYVTYNSESISCTNDAQEWHIEFQFTVTNVSIDKPEDYHESITVDFNPTVGDKVYILVMIFQTGDSYGYSTGNGEIIWAFNNIETATSAQLAILANIESQTLNFKTENCTMVKMSNPAFGYFEECTNLNIQEFMVQ